MTDISELQMTLKILGGNRQIDDIMHACDLFESFKCICAMRWETIEVSLKVDADKERVFSNLVKALCSPESPIRPIVVYEPETKRFWRDPAIKMISTGHQWGMLQEYLDMCELQYITALPVAPTPDPGRPPMNPQGQAGASRRASKRKLQA